MVFSDKIALSSVQPAIREIAWALTGGLILLAIFEIVTRLIPQAIVASVSLSFPY
jgi:hypothetical protein